MQERSVSWKKKTGLEGVIVRLRSFSFILLEIFRACQLLAVGGENRDCENDWARDSAGLFLPEVKLPSWVSATDNAKKVQKVQRRAETNCRENLLRFCNIWVWFFLKVTLVWDCRFYVTIGHGWRKFRQRRSGKLLLAPRIRRQKLIAHTKRE